jgi:hypothetical protein
MDFDRHTGARLNDFEGTGAVDAPHNNQIEMQFLKMSKYYINGKKVNR